MRVSLLLLLACTAVLAAQARADEPGEPEVLVRKVQEYAQKASAMAKSALSRVQESEVAQQARQWLSDNVELAKQRLVRFKEQLVQLWKGTAAA
ncbi:apolipoprotein C-III [Amazona aestiva]|uniref:Apolipoprotein C-III n=1 Tax=Amazona aestiva TaxID=12930 RepID=A0A0Q3T1Q2_AMAAE|nr:apolipoprotein C-III [Amazona aestiva]